MKQPVRIAALSVVAAVVLGLGLGVVVLLTGATGGQAEAAKPGTEQTGRLISLGTQNIPQGQDFTALVATDDCAELRVMVHSDRPSLFLNGWAHTSPDGVLRVLTNPPGQAGPQQNGDSITPGQGYTVSQVLVGPLPYYAAVINNNDPQTASVTTWAWCSFH